MNLNYPNPFERLLAVMGSAFLIIGLVGILSLALSGCSPDVIPNSIHSKSQKLIISGKFHGADSVLVQVYHDGGCLSSEEVQLEAYSLTLVQHQNYMIKFTSEKDKEKRLFIPYVAPDMVEITPDIDVDFHESGDLVMIKENSRKPGFDLFDCGLYRGRK